MGSSYSFSQFTNRWLFNCPFGTSLGRIFWLGRIIKERHLQVCHEHWLESILQQCREDHSEYHVEQNLCFLFQFLTFVWNAWRNHGCFTTSMRIFMVRNCVSQLLGIYGLRYCKTITIVVFMFMCILVLPVPAFYWQYGSDLTGQFLIARELDRQDSWRQANCRDGPWTSPVLKIQGRPISEKLFAWG